MKVYIDISVLTLATFITGIQRVTREIILRLLTYEDMEIILLHYNARENKFHKVNTKSFEDYYKNHIGRKEQMITRTRIELSEIGEGSVFFDLDAAWMGRVRRSYLLPILKSQGAEIIVHVYDIISITHPQYCLQRGVYYFMDYIGAHIQYADHIIVNAQATADELAKLTNKCNLVLPECAVVPLGADFNTKGNTKKEASIRPEVLKAVEKNPFVLMVGTLEPRKNHKLLIKAYDEKLSKIGMNIIIAGYKGWNMEDFMDMLKEHKDFNTRIFHFEGLSDDEITYLYQKAFFLVFSSYAEGFGLPLIESVERGTPVAASDIPVSREVAGEYCLYFEQDNPEALGSLLQYYLEHPEEYNRYRNKLSEYKSISWEESAARMRKELMYKM